jgi:high-affinity nickel-transport protein
VLSDDDPGLRFKVLGIYALLFAFSLLCWGLSVLTALHYPVFLALAATAFTLGLRHAFDADHIAAIDNVTRKLMQEKKKPATVGLYFSLGHSTVVVVVAVLVALGASALRQGIQNDSSGLETFLGLFATCVSALFLFTMGFINIVILVQIVKTFRQATHGGIYDEEVMEAALNQRGFLARIFRRLFTSIDASWKMYPMGFLFGLSFDTATEIGLFVMAGSVGTYHIPLYSAFLLPLMFAAGMTLMDTSDSIMMLGAYGWAFVKPIRKLFYNMTITLISILVALVIGALETLSILEATLNLKGGLWDFIGVSTSGNSFGLIGVGVITIFVLSWVVSTIIYRINRYDDLELPVAGATLAEINLTPISLLERIRTEGKTWEELAPRYGVTNPDPPWKVAFNATCEALAVSGNLPALQRRQAEDRLGETLYSATPAPEQQLLALAHTVLSRGTVSEEDLARQMQVVRARFDAVQPELR